MTLESQVCSLPLAQRLKELGVKQESYFFWWCDRYGIGDGNPHVQDHQPRNPKDGWRVVSAFTVAELGEILLSKWEQAVESAEGVLFGKAFKLPADDKEMFRWMVNADSYAKMLIYLVENKLIEVPAAAV